MQWQPVPANPLAPYPLYRSRHRQLQFRHGMADDMNDTPTLKEKTDDGTVPAGIGDHDAFGINGIALGLFPRFKDAHLERQFEVYYIDYYYRFAQASLCIGLLLIFGDFLVDRLAFPGPATNLLRITEG